MFRAPNHQQEEIQELGHEDCHKTIREFADDLTREFGHVPHCYEVCSLTLDK
jgi:hypothetical protein